MNKLLVLDFGSRFTKDIDDILTKLNINHEVVGHDYDFNLVNDEIKGIIFTGSRDTVYDGGRRSQSEFMHNNIPKLGICYGHQLLNDEYGGKVSRATIPEMEKQVEIVIDIDNELFEGMNKIQNVSMFHNDEVVEMGDGFICLAHGQDCKIAATYKKEFNIYTVQYHPECNTFADYSDEYFSNFAKICGV